MVAAKTRTKPNAMKEVFDLVKRDKKLKDDLKKAVFKEVQNNADFIATSRKLVLSCSCGMHSEVWLNSGFIAVSVEIIWREQHRLCLSPKVELRIN